MPITCTCPTCNKPLRVPDELIGRLVRCPGCQGTFPAAAAPTPPAPPPVPPAPQQIQPDPSPISDLPNLSYDDAPHAPPESFAPLVSGRANAVALVKGPSLALMIVSGILGGLAVLVFLFNVAYYLFLFSATSPTSTNTSPGGVTVTAEPTPFGNAFVGGALGLGINFVFLLINVAWAGAVFMGAQRMQKLRTYSFAMTSAILAMTPFSGCMCGICAFVPWLVTIGFGVWALVILCKPEVKAAFE